MGANQSASTISDELMKCEELSDASSSWEPIPVDDDDVIVEEEREEEEEEEGK